MALFEEYRPAERSAPLRGVLYRLAEVEDAAELTELVLEREGGDRAALLRGFEREGSGFFPPTSNRLFVAEHEGRAVGFGRAKHFRPAPDAGPRSAPQGWYLAGVLVERALRRRGLARGLTRARLAGLRGDTDEVFYLVNAQNRASIDLHAEFGFVEVTRDFEYPRVSFEGSEGILFRAPLGP